jgi:hypothetical protein
VVRDAERRFATRRSQQASPGWDARGINRLGVQRLCRVSAEKVPYKALRHVFLETEVVTVLDVLGSPKSLAAYTIPVLVSRLSRDGRASPTTESDVYVKIRFGGFPF